MRWTALASLAFAALAPAAALARESLDEAAVHVRELISYRAFHTGVLMSVFPQDAEVPVPGLPFGLQEYYAEYPGSNGDLLLLAMPVAAIYRNALPPNPPNLTLTINDLWGFGDGNLAAGRMRVALYGTLERVEGDDELVKCKQAYLDAHPDSRGWIGAGGPHTNFFARMRINKVYAFNGFGDVAYIGWVPLELYRASGAKMRSAKEARRDWPVPRQPEEAGSAALFGEAVAVEGEREEGKERFRIQW